MTIVSGAEMLASESCFTGRRTYTTPHAPKGRAVFNGGKRAGKKSMPVGYIVSGSGGRVRWPLIATTRPNPLELEAQRGQA